MPKYLDDYLVEDDSANATIYYWYTIADVPVNYSEVVTSPESKQWQNAMKEEMSALEENETFQLVPLPEGRTIVGVDGFML